jgi:glutamyl-tRNA reductase
MRGIPVSLHIVGLNHSTCPVQTRERLAAIGSKAAATRLKSMGWGEVVVVSTCNRFEAYVAGKAPGGGDALTELTRALEALAETSLTGTLYTHSGSAAADHLFKVAAGLDSLVLGETEILGQIKTAYESAQEQARVGKLTNVLFQRALFVAKAVRSQTAISEGQTSVASVAVELAKRIFGSLNDSRVLILGAGEMAEKTARHLQAAKVQKLYIANRTWEKARALSEPLGAKTVHWDDFSSRLAEVDVVVASTGAPHAIITRDLVAAALVKRGGRPLFFIDIAMPRDVEPQVDELGGVYVYSMQDFSRIVEENLSRRGGELRIAREIISHEANKFAAWIDSLDSGHEIALRHSDVRGHEAPLRSAL